MAEILAAVGYDADDDRAGAAIVAKQGLGTDPQVQTHEDALCLVFLETQFDELADQLGDDQMVEVVRKTAAKMSPDALAAAGSIPMTDAMAAAAAPGGARTAAAARSPTLWPRHPEG